MKVKLRDESIIAPTIANNGDAGIDVYCPRKINILPGQTRKIELGIAIEIAPDEVGIMSERSSMGVKGVTSVGNIIDSSYRGYISIILQNNSVDTQKYKPGDRIGQIVICKLGNRNIEIVEELSETDRNEGGFGSSGA